MFESYVIFDGNDEYLKLNYIKDNNSFPIHVYRKKYVIPKNCYVLMNKSNKNIIKDLVNKKYLDELIFKEKYVFVKDYSIEKDLLRFVKIIGIGDSYPTNFLVPGQKNKIFFDWYDNSYNKKELTKLMIMNKIPLIYIKYFDTLMGLFLGCFVRLFLFDDSEYNTYEIGYGIKINKSNIQLDKINELLDFYYSWWTNYHWDLECFHEMKDFESISSIKLKIYHLYSCNIIIKEHKNKLINLLKQNELYVINQILELLRKPRYKTIYLIYQLIENVEDTDLKIIKPCCCQ